MVKLIFVDNDFEEMESADLDMTIEEAMKSLPTLDFKIGGICYEKKQVIIDIKEKTIEIQFDVQNS